MINSFVIQDAAINFGNNLKGYCQDLTFGTQTCPASFYDLLKQWLLIIGATDNCNLATIEQLTCFYNALTKCSNG